ncbi:MAG TPA: leucine-rich repeat domain-containing protein [Candidatus Hydrogenedentes bacterium]|nr:leucine-rich repeat domain-containing protein [Candidatus Hydrogenedentota bacterium]
MGMQLILRWRYVALAMVLLVTVSACSPIVIIPDKALESAIRAEIRKPLSIFLTKRDLSGVRKLNASELNISNLEGLQFCVNINHLNLTNNSIRDISQIGSLTKLVRLHLGNNKIMDIEAIAGLLALEYLDLSGDTNVISDWRHLEANVLNGGLGFESTVKVPYAHTFDSQGNPLPTFKGAFDAMRDAGVILDTGQSMDEEADAED